MFDEFDYTEKVVNFLKTFGLQEDVAKNMVDPTRACLNPWGFERVELAKKYLLSLPKLSVEDKLKEEFKKVVLKNHPHPHTIGLNLVVESNGDKVSFKGEVYFKEQNISLNLKTINLDLQTQVTEPRLWWFLSENSPFYSYDLSLIYQENILLDKISTLNFSDVIIGALVKIKDNKQPTYKPRWVNPVESEEFISHEGFEIFIAKSQGSYLWVAFDKDGGSEDGKALSKDKALEHAQSMVEAFKSDF